MGPAEEFSRHEGGGPIHALGTSTPFSNCNNSPDNDMSAVAATANRFPTTSGPGMRAQEAALTLLRTSDSLPVGAPLV